MNAAPQARLLPDGKRLHLHHGPIDLIIEAFGPGRDACYQTAITRFETILPGLVTELTQLRRPLTRLSAFRDPVARRMARAVQPHRGVFVTPMAAVAGSVADEMLSAMVSGHAPPKAFVNNGGDIAFHLSGTKCFSALGPTGTIEIAAVEKPRGVATSGWRGRSHSLGIADAVTVVAGTAAEADVAATLIANAVDLPGHPGVDRTPAYKLAPDSDLGNHLVTTHVAPLTASDATAALSYGAEYAQDLRRDGLISQAVLSLQGHHQTVLPAAQSIRQGEPTHA